MTLNYKQIMMNKGQEKINRKTLINLANSLLAEEFSVIPKESDSKSSVSEDNEIKTKDENYKPILLRYNQLRDKGDWEGQLSDMAPLKEGIIRRVNKSKILPNSGLTPLEMMYGEQCEDDFDYIGKSLQ